MATSHRRKMTEEELDAFLADERVLHLATVDEAGWPAVVPIDDHTWLRPDPLDPRTWDFRKVMGG